MERDEFDNMLNEDDNPFNKYVDKDHDLKYWRKWCREHGIYDWDDCYEYYEDEEKQKNDRDDWDDHDDDDEDELEDDEIALIAFLISLGAVLIIVAIVLVVAKVKGLCCFKPKEGKKNKGKKNKNESSKEELIDGGAGLIEIEDDGDENKKEEGNGNAKSQDAIVYPTFGYEANNGFQQQRGFSPIQPMQAVIYNQQPTQQALMSILDFSNHSTPGTMQSHNMVQGGFQMAPTQQPPVVVIPNVGSQVVPIVQPQLSPQGFNQQQGGMY